MSKSRWQDWVEILLEDNHLIAVNKPSGWATTHYDGQSETIDQLVKDYLREEYNKPGNIYLGVVQRLDKPTSGVLTFARTSKAAARLSEQFKAGAVAKTYWLVTRHDENWPLHGTLIDTLWHDDQQQRIIVVPTGTPGGQLAKLTYTTRGVKDGWAWIEVQPHTGRKHQIRVQFSSRGLSIFGDAKYGSESRFGDAIGLHSRACTYLHPTLNTPVELTAAVPREWQSRFGRWFPEMM
ncbi:MAG: RluA family pseudouridine synthase [Gemmataceae bacterium]